MVWVWLAFALAGFVRPAWQWFRRQRSQSWPTAQGQIEQVSVEPPSQLSRFVNAQGHGSTYTAQLVYSYVVGGQAYRGRWRQEFGSEDDATGFIRGLEGRPVLVLYNPGRTSSSTLLESAVAALLESRPPSAYGNAGRETYVPAWARPLLWPFVLLSAAGLVLSMWVHFGAIAGRRVAPEPFFWILHGGVFIVWFPAIFIANRRGRKARKRDFWKAAFKDSPSLKYVFYAFSGYAVLSSLIFSAPTPVRPAAIGYTPVEIWLRFSSGWMVFYSAALTILYSAAQTPSESRIEPPSVEGDKVRR
jgi:hypothetical protein